MIKIKKNVRTSYIHKERLYVDKKGYPSSIFVAKSNIYIKNRQKHLLTNIWCYLSKKSFKHLFFDLMTRISNHRGHTTVQNPVISIKSMSLHDEKVYNILAFQELRHEVKLKRTQKTIFSRDKNKNFGRSERKFQAPEILAARARNNKNSQPQPSKNIFLFLTCQCSFQLIARIDNHIVRTASVADILDNHFSIFYRFAHLRC